MNTPKADKPTADPPEGWTKDDWVAWERDEQGRLWANSWSCYRCRIDEERNEIAEKEFVK